MQQQWYTSNIGDAFSTQLTTAIADHWAHPGSLPPEYVCCAMTQTRQSGWYCWHVAMLSSGPHNIISWGVASGRPTLSFSLSLCVSLRLGQINMCGG
jgi:hypothetical protein